MKHRLLAAILLLGTGCQAASGVKLSLNDLSLEVDALNTLYLFQLSPRQMQALKKLAPETTTDAIGPREMAKASAAYRKALTNLHEALLKPAEDKRIAEMVEQLDALHAKENPQFDDGIEITEAARKRAPEFAKALSARQVMSYLTSLGEDVSCPLERLLDALEKARGMKEPEWKELRRTIGPHVGTLVAGLDDQRAARVGDRAVQLLIRVRALNDAEFMEQRMELEAEARQIVGPIGPTDVLRHVVEHAVAELLSNPRLEQALAGRLK